MATALKELTWYGEDVRLADVDTALARLRSQAASETASMRTSVMTHIAWVPAKWVKPAREALEGMAERHPSRTILLLPEPRADDNRIDGRAQVERWEVPDTDRGLVTEVVELTLRGSRAKAPASIVEPLLIPDLPVFLRWRGEPVVGRTGARSAHRRHRPADRRLDRVGRRAGLVQAAGGALPALRHLGHRVGSYGAVALSPGDALAWDRRRADGSAYAGRRRRRASSAAGCAPGSGGTDIALEHDPAEKLLGVTLDGEAVPLPPGDPPTPSDVLSDELERFTPDPVYEAAVLAATAPSA